MKMTIKFLHRGDAAIFFDPELSDRELFEVASQNLLDKVCTRLTLFGKRLPPQQT